jgi:septal ring factor EnvC (AmiA/AmiB activator)
MAKGAGAAVPALPLRPFRGDLEWPVLGPVVAGFGRMPAGRFGTAIARNGIEIGAKERTQVRAVHDGTVAFAAPFTGFGTLVIVDHGGAAFSLYGHLSQALVTKGAPVRRGTVVGSVGLSPGGGAALYFELRIDGRPVDPVQWLRR